MAVTAAIGGGVMAINLAPTPALADPTNPPNRLLAGVGDQTTQDVMNALSNDIPTGACVDPGPQGSADPGSSSDPPVASSGGDIVNDQLIDVGGQILAAVDATNYPGFAGVVADPDHALLQLYWLPNAVLPPAIDQIVQNPPSGIAVQRMDAPHSRAQLSPIANQL